MNYEKFLNQQLKWVRKHGTVESVEKHNWWIAQLEELAKREAIEFPAQPPAPTTEHPGQTAAAA